MAVPKSKITKQKRNAKRQHIRIKDISLIECTNCKQKKENHLLCNSCGYYKNKEYVKIKSAKKKSAV